MPRIANCTAASIYESIDPNKRRVKLATLWPRDYGDNLQVIDDRSEKDYIRVRYTIEGWLRKGVLIGSTHDETVPRKDNTIDFYFMRSNLFNFMKANPDIVTSLQDDRHNTRIAIFMSLSNEDKGIWRYIGYEELEILSPNQWREVLQEMGKEIRKGN